MEYNIIIPIYEGPMDLLLDLIKDNEIDIYDIPISLITEQFLNYLDQAAQINLELTSEFILMASTLVEIKSKMLIPKTSFTKEEMVEEEEKDPREELVRKLLEYEKYKEASELLRKSQEYEKKALYKVREEIHSLEDLDLIKEGDIQKLSKAFLAILQRNKSRNITSIYRDKFTVEEGISNILSRLLGHRTLSFEGLLEEDSTKIEIITYFLSLLELIKMGTVIAKQHLNNQDIIIFLRKDPHGKEKSQINY
ncbi:MAG: segregation/condensation protein A [Tissierellia bacterium]|nr:segregation/condensation protein A [Tissierellia bacterium]